jgi:hypothetical protein
MVDNGAALGALSDSDDNDLEQIKNYYNRASSKSPKGKK